MKTTMFAAVALLMLFVNACAPTYAQTEVQGSYSYRSPDAGLDFSLFYDDLSPYGQWIEVAPYGWCWTPYDVSASWRPYSDGYWIYTDFGWSWVSYEPFGWATYHYGRWAFDPDFGWIWVPGTDWAPAWVAWRYGDDCVGWAPLPPQATWQVSVGLRFGDTGRIPYENWCFVSRRDFLDTNLRVQVVSVARNRTLLERSRDVTRFEDDHGRPIDRGIGVRDAERWTGRKVRRFEVADSNGPGRAGKDALQGGRVEYFRPDIRRPDRGREPAPSMADRGPGPSERRSPQEWQDRQQRLERDLSQERARLERHQQQEMRSRPRGTSRRELERRHREEKRAFEEHAARQRQVLKERHQRGIRRPDRGQDRNHDSRRRDRGNGRGHGSDRNRGKGGNHGHGNG